MCINCNVSNCIECSADNSCATCSNGFTVSSSGTCVNCTGIVGCASCSSNNVCATCTAGYTLNGTICTIC